VTGGVRRWPLFLIAAPAGVSIWSGWVGLGGMCGFGEVQPLPGILPLHLNTALTLPLGIESYAALALGAWLRPDTWGRARNFARWSALGALGLGMLGQLSYHLLAARHSTDAPDIVVVLVACLPVVVLGCAVALLHLQSAALPTTSRAHAATRSSRPVRAKEALSDAVATAAGGACGKRIRVSDEDAQVHFATDLASGHLPSARRIQRELHVGQARAADIRRRLGTVVKEPDATGGATNGMRAS